MVKTLQEQREDVPEPYMGVTPDSRFELATSTTLPADITLDRLNRRRTLVEQFDQARRELDHSTAGRDFNRYREMAFTLIDSDRVHKALDLNRESPRLRESYGMTLFGQGALAARRLVEAGSRFVTVFWDEYGLAGSGWDTHWNHYPRMRDELMPGFDRAFAGLIEDLDARGMLDETLVVCLSEHGRTPKMNNAKGGGRDHWSQAYSGVFAGGGIARGKVIGKTDKIAASVTERPVSPKDILATVYHLLGIDPHTLLADRAGRPVPLVQDAEVVREMMI
jgi:membrane-anchored protein YejM (alkaline phosphatase superfamily)